MGTVLALRRLATALLLAGLLAGCQTLGRGGRVASSVTTELTAAAATTIADDLAAPLAAQIGAGTTTLALNQDGSSFGKAFEAALRGKGYAILTSQRSDAADVEPIAYVVDEFEGQVLVRISLQRMELTRVYERSAAGAEPISPLSVMDHSMAAAS